MLLGTVIINNNWQQQNKRQKSKQFAENQFDNMIENVTYKS